MRFSSQCPHCPGQNRVEWADDNIHPITCQSCARAYCLYVRKQKFEVLFDLGTRALLDGYAREAVASFAAALERFMEFYVRAYTLERAVQSGQDLAAAEASLNATWRHVVSQSERQLGMFALTYLWREGQEPQFLNPKALGVDFRNRVIHRGYVPKRQEVEGYAAKIFVLINHLLSRLGPTAQHAEAAQEREFVAHQAGLAPDVPAVYEEHPGMFRARQFVGKAPTMAKGLWPQLPAPQPNVLPASSNELFEKALVERGRWLSLL